MKYLWWCVDCEQEGCPEEAPRTFDSHAAREQWYVEHRNLTGHADDWRSPLRES